MATRYKQSFETGTIGSAITTSNPSGDNPFNAASFTGGSGVIDATHVMHGSQASKITPASGQAASDRWSGLGVAPGATFGVSGYAWYDTLPSDETYIWRLNDTANALICMLEFSNSGKFRVIDKSGTSTPLFTSSANIPLGQYLRYEAFGTIGSSASIKAALFVGDSTTPISGYSMSSSTANLGTTTADVGIFGKGNTGLYTAPFWMDSVQMEVGGSDYIGPWTTPLATPVVTLGNTINPTTVGGTDGSQVVTWPAVSNATTYDAYKATKASPSQSDFTLVASSVTSPYTFASLAAGTYSFGIQAKP